MAGDDRAGVPDRGFEVLAVDRILAERLGV